MSKELAKVRHGNKNRGKIQNAGKQIAAKLGGQMRMSWCKKIMALVKGAKYTTQKYRTKRALKDEYYEVSGKQ